MEIAPYVDLDHKDVVLLASSQQDCAISRGALGLGLDVSNGERRQRRRPGDACRRVHKVLRTIKYTVSATDFQEEQISMGTDDIEVHVVVAALLREIVVESGGRRRRGASKGDAQVSTCGGVGLRDGLGVGNERLTGAGALGAQHHQASLDFGGGGGGRGRRIRE